MLFFAFKRSEIFASISIFAFEAKTRAHPTTDPSLQKMRIRVLSASQVGKLLTNILLAVTISTRSPSIPFVLATACAVYASKVLPYAAHTLAIC
jgi:Na+-translocating ferredoxin:NAD+ oxidoreductase RnfD subunit